MLSPEIETTLVSQMAGTIVALNASLGAAVAKGSAIVSFDCREASAKLRMAEAELPAAKEPWRPRNVCVNSKQPRDLEVSQAAVRRRSDQCRHRRFPCPVVQWRMVPAPFLAGL